MPVPHVLPFQLVPVRAGHDTQPGQSGQIGRGGGKPFFADGEPFLHRQGNGYYSLQQKKSLPYA